MRRRRLLGERVGMEDLIAASISKRLTGCVSIRLEELCVVVASATAG